MRTHVASIVAASVLAGVVPAAASAPDVPVPGPTLRPAPTATLQPAPTPSASAPARAAADPCTIEGDDGPNRLTGTPGPDVICGRRGDDVIEGLEGDDVLDGGAGSDTATWETAPCCVSADLAAGAASGTMGADGLISIEHLTGSGGTDVLRGDGGPNLLSGLASTDLLYGGDGDDTLLGGDGDDWLAGEGGANALDGGPGANVCADGPGTACDPPSPADLGDTRGRLDVALVTTSLDADPATWRLRVRRRSPAVRLWDEGYAVVSFDTRGGDDFEVHAVMRWKKKKVKGLLLSEGARRPAGRVKARRAGGRGVLVRVPLGRLGIDPERRYYRWAVRTIFTAKKCRPCFDTVPGSGAYPQPLA